MFWIFLLFLLLTGAITSFGYKHYVRPGLMLDQLASSTSDAVPRQIGGGGKPDDSTFSLSKFLTPIGNLLPVSPQDAQFAKQELSAAGFRGDSAVPVFFGCKLCLAASFVIFALLFRNHLENPLFRVISPIAGGGLGYLLPVFLLGRMVKKRHLLIRQALPDVLDLLVICTEAGCGLDQAIVNVSRELKSVHPEVSEELLMVNMEIMAGTTRADALRNFARRTGEDEVKKLVAILIQTDRFGTSVAEALRTQSDFLRIRRKQDSEEKAGKVGVKLVFPIFFFCLPSLVVVTAGPGMLQLFTSFGTLHP